MEFVIFGAESRSRESFCNHLDGDFSSGTSSTRHRMLFAVSSTHFDPILDGFSCALDNIWIVVWKLDYAIVGSSLEKFLMSSAVQSRVFCGSVSTSLRMKFSLCLVIFIECLCTVRCVIPSVGDTRSERESLVRKYLKKKDGAIKLVGGSGNHEGMPLLRFRTKNS